MGERVEHAFERAVPTPLLEPAMAGLVGRISIPREILPAGSAAKHPQDAVQHVARIPPRTPAPVPPALRLPDQRSHERPLFFRQVHATPHKGVRVLEDRGGVRSDDENTEILPARN